MINNSHKKHNDKHNLEIPKIKNDTIAIENIKNKLLKEYELWNYIMSQPDYR